MIQVSLTPEQLLVVLITTCSDYQPTEQEVSESMVDQMKLWLSKWNPTTEPKEFYMSLIHSLYSTMEAHANLLDTNGVQPSKLILPS